MIDPTNTEPIPVHTPHVRRVLSALAIILLTVVAVVLVLRNTNFSDEIHTVQVPEPNPAFTPDVQAELVAIQERVTRGEISREEGERLTNELLRNI